MLRQAFRRLFWMVPTLIGITLASFVLLSYVPGPADDPNVLAVLGEERAAELRRSRFLDLPRFFNQSPIDVRARVRTLLEGLRSGELEVEQAPRMFSQLGGAALPFVLPQLDTLAPETRTHVALALSPIAARMGIRADAASDPSRAVAFWNRFWADRALDFRATNARRAIRRLAQHATVTRQSDVLELDTFVLEPLMLELAELLRVVEAGSSPPTPDDLQRTHTLIAIAEHVSGRSDTFDAAAGATEAAQCIRRWQSWWLVHASDYIAHDGIGRLLATITETQYAKWVQRAALFGAGGAGGDEPVGRLLYERCGTTLSITLGAMLLAYLIAVVVPALGEAQRRGPIHGWIAGVSIAAHAVPTACLAVFVSHRVGAPRGLTSIVILACSLVASPLMQQRTAMREVSRQDYARFALAYGLSPFRIALRHALRNAILPSIALFSFDLPVALGGAFVVETALGIRGLAEPTLRAVQANDVAWLSGLAFLTALIVTSSTLVGDLVMTAVDPRLSASVLRQRRTAP